MLAAAAAQHDAGTRFAKYAGAPLRGTLAAGGVAAAPAPSSRSRRGRWGRLVARLARLHAVLTHEGRLQLLSKHDGALQLALHRLELFGRLPGDRHRGRFDLRRHRRRPRFRVADQRHVSRLDHFECELLELPSPAEVPGLQPGVLQPVAGELFARPVRRRFVLRRRGEPRAHDRHQMVERGVHLRAVQAFAANPGNHGAIHGVLRGRTGDQYEHGNCGGGEGGDAHGGILVQKDSWSVVRGSSLVARRAGRGVLRATSDERRTRRQCGLDRIRAIVGRASDVRARSRGARAQSGSTRPRRADRQDR